MASAFETSQLIAATLRPGAPASILALASASVPGSRARIATSAPERAYSVAIARPSPLLPPVITALRPSSRISISAFLLQGCQTRVMGCQPVDLLHVLGRE